MSKLVLNWKHIDKYIIYYRYIHINLYEHKYMNLYELNFLKVSINNNFLAYLVRW